MSNKGHPGFKIKLDEITQKQRSTSREVRKQVVFILKVVEI